jgi:hypothetical protein
MTAAVDLSGTSAVSALAADALTVLSPIGPLRVSAEGAGASPLRLRMEAFVRLGYRDRFGAQVASFLPGLLGASDASGALRAVLGYRIAGRQALFLEQYLDVPIERALAAAVGAPVSRDRVLEAGNLVTDPTIVAPAFFQAFLVWITATTKCEWLVFTGTRTVLLLLRRMGAEMRELAAADPERLRDAPDRWGAYYDHQPRVVAVSIASLGALLEPARFGAAELAAWLERGRELRR